MAFSVAKALILLQLSLLFVGSFSAEIDTLIPALPPMIAPGPKVAPVPILPPKLYNRLVVCQGMVYRKACEFAGKDHLWKATPVSGANVTMVCRLSKIPQKYTCKTDKNGYFWCPGPRTTHPERCRVFLEKSTMPDLGKPSSFNNGALGKYLTNKPTFLPNGFSLFTVGNYAYEPAKCPKI